ncbi:cytochrome P450-domain-containing protein [Aspergillus stella-maris]|uniref:cytochrome P450-domain-containing protein n=1 Tax=Aspergillus stella-maris TaxID=1810926 RepID=UPI003CCE2C63
MAELSRPPVARCPPSRQVRGTRLNTIIEDSREAQYADKTGPSPTDNNVQKSPVQKISAPQLKLKTAGLPSPLARRQQQRFLSPLSAGSNQMKNFDDLYDATDDESDFSDECISYSSSRPTSLSTPITRTDSVVSPGSRKRFPALHIPASNIWPSLNGAPKSSPVPPTPPQKIPVSPAALSLLSRTVPGMHATPSLDGSVSSDQVSNISTPSTPSLKSLPDTDWNQREIHVLPDLEGDSHPDMNSEADEEVPTIEVPIESADDDWRRFIGEFPQIPDQSTIPVGYAAEPARGDTPSDRGVALPEGALATLNFIPLEGTPEPWSETSEDNEEMWEVDAPREEQRIETETPKSGLSDYSFSSLSIPSPGGFFDSLGPRARHTWSFPRFNQAPTSATAEKFYNVPFRRSEGEIVEQVIHLPERSNDEQLTAIYAPPTALRIPESPAYPPTEGTISPVTEGVHEISRPVTTCDPDEQDENYAAELQKKALSSLDRTSVWLAAQATYLSALSETNPVNVIEEPEEPVDVEDKPAEAPTAQVERKKSVKFIETLPELPSSLPGTLASKDSIYWRGFKFLLDQSRGRDTFVHRGTRFDAVQSTRLGLSGLHNKCLLGNYELVPPKRPSYSGPFSQAPRNSVLVSVLQEKAKFSMVEKEQLVLSQISQPIWAMEALRYLYGGSLIANPAKKRLSRRSTNTAPRKNPKRRQLRVLDLGGHATAEWAWHLAHDYPHVKVYTVYTEHQQVNQAIKGPPNHKHIQVSQLWKLPFGDNKFDIISARSLPAFLKTERPAGESQDEYDLCLQECYRCLKPGGYLEYFLMDAEIARAGPYASATSIEFSFSLKIRGYDPTPTKSFLSRLRKSHFTNVRRGWMYLPMGTEPLKPQVPRETPDPRVKSLIEDYEAVQGPLGSTADTANITGLLGGWIWEQWLLKLQVEMGRGEEKLLEGIGSVFDEGRKNGAGWTCLTGWAMKPLPARHVQNGFFKTLTNQVVTIELKNDIRIRGTLKSVDQYLNIKLDDIDVLDLDKYPHLSSVKNMFIRGSVVRYVVLPRTDGPPKSSSHQARITHRITAPRPRFVQRESSGDGKGQSGEGEGLFLEDKRRNALHSGDGDRRDGEEVERERSKTPDDFWDEGVNGSKDEDEERYNENGSAVKRRKVETPSSAGGSTAEKAKEAPKRAKKVSGPFIDESDSEEEDGKLRTESIGESNGKEEELKTPLDEEQPAKREIAADVPPLVREVTSHMQDDDYPDFDDIDEGEEGDEGLDFVDEDAIKEEETPGYDETPTCPVCQGDLEGYDQMALMTHVNACLDGRPSDIAPKKPTPSESTPNPKTPAERAAIARPAQRDPVQDKSIKSSTAFSKIMAGNAEDTAWAEAAASDVASRGKQAYQRTCPFYKIITGFSISVDAFRYGAVENCDAYFLSHFHSDHYIGLSKSWQHGPIYCSRATANLVRQQLRVDPKWLVDLDFEKKTEVPNTGGVQVTMMEANHCPGSSIFLFEKAMTSGKIQRVLHCGDFRASPQHVRHALLRPDVVDTKTGKSWQQRIDACYLDTTYLSPKYAFPRQSDVICACAELCSRIDKGEYDALGHMPFQTNTQVISKNPISKFISSAASAIKSSTPTGPTGRLLVVIGTYSIGKERICLAIAKALNSKIYATPAKKRVVTCLEDPELSSLLTDDPLEAQVHMQTLFEIRAETLCDYLDSLKPHFTRVVGFRPTGWTYRPPAGRTLENPPVSTVLHSPHWRTPFSVRDLTPQRGSTRESACFGVPYSEHSSFRELTMFCCALRIGRIIPTVNVGSAKSRERMKGWFDKWEAEKRKSGLLPIMITDILSPEHITPERIAYALLGLLAVYYVIPYLQTWRLSDIPAPGLAAWTNFWLLFQARKGERFLTVDKAHKKHGKLVRIAPRHISIADDAAINAVYGHGNGFLKADFYDAFVSIRRGLFNTRDRAEHTRKRKTVSHTFSAKSIGQFEQYIHGNIENLVKQLNRTSDLQRNPKTGYATVDALNWFNFVAFDIIGDLAFGAPFGMLDKGQDIAEMRKFPDAPPQYVQAVEVLNRRGEVSATLGCYPALKPFAKYLPDRFFRDGLQAVENLAGIAIACVNERLKPEVMANNTRVDLLARLMEGKDANGNKLGRAELTAEALTQLIAGSDTTSNTSCAILYWCLRTPGVIERLHKELDEAIPKDIDVPTHAMVKDIPYLQWIISETMRIHSTSAMGLPREIPEGNAPVEISGHIFKPGDVLSVPSYTIHHSKEIWGADADDFVPERWAPERLTARQKAAFIPFSHGPRACVGRNVAEMELLVICATVFRVFDWQLQQEGPMETREGFLRKPLGLTVGVKRRAVA